MKKIQLGGHRKNASVRGFAIVDNKDFEYLNQYRWYPYARGKYAVTKRNRKVIFMHHLICKTPKGFLTDHINRNTHDNRRKNLRVVTREQNMFNVPGIGVGKHKHTNKWRAFISSKNKHIHLGVFSSRKKALEARKKAKQKYHVI